MKYLHKKGKIFNFILIFFLCIKNVFSIDFSLSKVFPEMTGAAQKFCEKTLKDFEPEEAAEKLSVAAKDSKVKTDSRLLYTLAAQIYEEIGFYNEAQKLYSVAASVDLAATTENASLSLNAVRCALSRGDYLTADILLNSVPKGNLSEDEMARGKLYGVWQWFCKIETVDDIHEPLVILKSYVDLPSMKSVKPQVLLTLWHITGEIEYSDKLKKIYPNSPETAIVENKAKLLPAPFWFFIRNIAP